MCISLGRSLERERLAAPWDGREARHDMLPPRWGESLSSCFVYHLCKAKITNTHHSSAKPVQGAQISLALAHRRDTASFRMSVWENRSRLMGLELVDGI